jgi:RNA polymerase sigma-70 factor (ECF subfamily)
LGVTQPPTSRSRRAIEPADAEAFGRLFDRHVQAVYGFCARRCANLALAEDLTSATFLEAWRHRRHAPLEDDERARPWLLGVANNVVRNALRGRRREDVALGRLPAPATAPAAEDDAAARATTEAGLRRALEAIAGLADGERDVVMLVLWSELSYEDAAVALDIPLGTVRSRLARARSKLQGTLGDDSTHLLKEIS